MRRALGSISKLGKDYYKVRVTGGTDPTTGKSKRLTKYVRGSRAKAEQVLAAMLTKSGHGAEVAEDITLDGFWENTFLPNAETRLKATTVDGYEKDYNGLIKPYLGTYKLDRITPPVISSWLECLPNAKRRLKARGMLRTILNRAMKSGLLSVNPVYQVEPPRVERYRPEVLDGSDAARYIQEAKGTFVEPAVLMAIGAGLRREEIIALNWSDIGRDGSVVVDDAIPIARGKPVHEDTPKSDFSNRTVYLPQSITDRLNELRPEKDGPFIVHNGERSRPDYLTRQYAKWRDRLPEGVQRISLKNLRHTSLTLALEGGAELLAVSRRAGHSNVSVTAQYYLRPHKNIDQAAARGLDDLLNG